MIKKLLFGVITAIMCIGMFKATEISVSAKSDWMQEAMDKMEKETVVSNIRSLINDDRVYYTYERHPWGGCRIVEETNGKEVVKYSYNDNSSIIQSIYGDHVVDYHYADMTLYHYLECTSFSYDGKEYYYTRDEKNWISGFCDENGISVCKYDYNESGDRIIYKVNSDGSLEEVSEDEEFIGSINLLWQENMVYDRLSGYSLSYGQLHDPVSWDSIWTSLYPDLIEEENRDCVPYEAEMDRKRLIEAEKEEELAEFEEKDRNLKSSGDDIIDEMYNSCISDTSFGEGISYSSNWYSGLSDLEIMARLLYGETMNNNVVDVNAVTWELCNRKAANWSGFYGTGNSNTFRNIMLKGSAYAAITAGISETDSARNPYRNTSRWNKSVRDACSLMYAVNRTALQNYIPKPAGINKQCYHVGMVFYGYFTGTSAATLKYNGSNIKHLTLTTVNSSITDSTLLAGYYINHSDRNLFFTYSGELGVLYNI